MNIFERASRNQLRFKSGKGNLSCEDLWALSLDALDQMAKHVYKSIKDSTEFSFIGGESDTDKESKLRLDILKHVIESKLSDRQAAKTRADNAAKAARIKDLIGQKQDEELKGKSLEELNSLLDSIGS